MKKPKVISLFTGAGGLDLGFEAAGFEVVLAADIMPEACATLKKAKSKRKVFGPPNESGSIFDIDLPTIKSVAGLSPGELDVMIGGPPCQPFSVAAAQRFLKTDINFKRKGFDCGEKGQLIFAYVDLIISLMPKAFLIENVPGILSIDGGESIKYLLSSLEEAGYTISTPMVLDAKDFGVPQNRKRAFIIGSRDGHLLPPPEQTHSEFGGLFTAQHRGVAEALWNFDYSLPNSDIRDHAPASIRRYKKLHFGQRDHLGRVDRLDPHLPSKTVIAGGTAGGGRSHLHPFQARTLSARECARLQTFPDDYIFIGKNGRQFTQVGNAVPPLLAEVLARQMMKHFFKGVIPRKLRHELPPVSQSDAVKDLLKWSVRVAPNLLYNDFKNTKKR
jgi:DNA (cytosine-5)-methyltransferase 1